MSKRIHQKNALRALAACFCILAVIGGCEPTKATRTTTSTQVAGIVVAQTPNLPPDPKRIVSMAPNVTEVLFAVGAHNKLVGVTRFCDFPGQVAKLPKIGGIVDPDFEAILGLRPDLVIGVTSAGDPKITASLDAAKIPYVFFRMETLQDTYAGIEGIAQLAGEAKKGKTLAQDMEKTIEGFGRGGGGKKPTVLLLFGRKPLIAAGPNTFADDLITRAGGQNVLNQGTQYPKLDIEKVLELNPDRIIDLSMVEERGDDTFWDTYPSLHAVAAGNVYRMTDPALMRPGPRLVNSFQKLAMAIKGKHGNH